MFTDVPKPLFQQDLIGGAGGTLLGLGNGGSSSLYNWSTQNNVNGNGNSNANVSGIYIEIDGGSNSDGISTTVTNAVHSHGTRRELPTVSCLQSPQSYHYFRPKHYINLIDCFIFIIIFV